MKRFAAGPWLLALFVATMLAMPAVAAAVPVQDPDQEQEEQAPPTIDEIVVVTASRTEQLLLEAPTAISVIDAADIALSPARNYADLLRGVPGLNVTQTSARDMNMSARSATSTLDASQLVLVDGRTVYLDFFGFVAWDLLPLDFAEIEQIEVIRGPSSAVWGANALNGVINIITKSPRSYGNSFRIRAGGGDQGTGFGSFTWANSNASSAYRFSGSYYTQDPWPRPGPLPNGIARDTFPNEGTQQPKGDFRADFNAGSEGMFSLFGGIAGAGGTIHTGIGPFSIKQGMKMWYGRADYNVGDLNIRAYTNVLDGDATNLLNGLPFLFESTTWDFSATNTSFFGNTAVTYGGNYRNISFDLSIAPDEDKRTEGGGFATLDLNVSDAISIDAGVRVDKFSVLDDAVASPRGAILIRPAGSNHVFRAGFGRAFRAPSLINNFLEVSIFNAVTLPVVGQFIFPSIVVGNPDLVEERLDSFEIGYRGSIANGKVSWDIAAYRTETKDSIDFYTSDVYTAFSPPPGWPLPAFFLPPFGPVLLPARFSYRNIGETVNKGFEIGVRAQPAARNSLIVSYSYQDEPEITGIPQGEIGIPPKHRFNIAWNGFAGNLFYGASVNHTGSAFWTDVLDSRFWGTTPPFTTVDASLGHMFMDGTAEASVRVTNLMDEEVLQHIFGDLIGRRAVFEIALNIR